MAIYILDKQWSGVNICSITKTGFVMMNMYIGGGNHHIAASAHQTFLFLEMEG